jgi:cold shock CspA family protein
LAYKLRTFHGTVVRWWPEKAYGYARIDGSPRQAHIHLRDFDRVGGDQITIGKRLEFYLADDRHGLRAVNVTLKE